ncbi:MAG: hypothetical protein WB930_02760 [Syntrophobacteraceae bacterium]
MCDAAHDIGCILNQAANFQETGRNIEQRAEGWKSDAGGESLKFKTASPLPLQPETRKDLQGNTYLLS